MVRGFSIAVTAVAPKNQCAETTRIARGRGSCRPKSRHACVKPFCSSVFIGLPWPMNNAGIRAKSDLQDYVGLTKFRLQDELGDIVDRCAAGRSPFVSAVVGVSVDDRFHVVEAVDRFAQALRAEILEDRWRFALDRSFDRRIVKNRDAAVRPWGAELILQLAGLVHHFVDEGLGDRLAEGRELAAPVSPHEPLHPREADTVDLDRLLV